MMMVVMTMMVSVAMEFIKSIWAVEELSLVELVSNENEKHCRNKAAEYVYHIMRTNIYG